MPSKRCAVLLAAAALAGCGDDGDPDAPAPPDAARGCPVADAVVAEAVAHPVTVERGNQAGVCAYVGEGDAAGARVEIAVESLAERGFADVLAEVERRVGPTEALDEGDVDGSQLGWTAAVGRSVQVGAAGGERLVVVAVTEPLLDALAAREVAIALAGEALDG